MNIKYLDNQERSQLLKTLADRKSAERDYMIIDLFLHTGLRISELQGLDVGSLEGRKNIIIRGKRDKVREVPLNSHLRSQHRAPRAGCRLARVSRTEP